MMMGDPFSSAAAIDVDAISDLLWGGEADAKGGAGGAGGVGGAGGDGGAEEGEGLDQTVGNFFKRDKTPLFSTEMADVAVAMDAEVTPALPNWVWIQSWQVDAEGAGFVEDDRDEGWTYGKDLKTIMAGHGSPTAGVNEGIMGRPARELRRRRWIRRCMVKDIEGVSMSGRKVLEMQCHIASLEVVAQKFTEQLLDLQTQHTDIELDAMKVR